MARKKIAANYDNMKQSIIQVSIEIMVKKNMAEFNLTDVANAVGLTKAAIYWYFPNKDALLEEVAQCIYETYIGFADQIASSDISPYEKLEQIILGTSDTISGALMCVFPLKFYLASYGKDDAIRTLIRKGYETYNGLIYSIISQGIQCGEFQSDLSIEDLTKFITGSIDGLAFQNLLVSSENIEVPRNIILSVVVTILKPCKR